MDAARETEADDRSGWSRRGARWIVELLPVFVVRLGRDPHAPRSRSSIHIIVGYDRAKFIATLTEH